jgi:ubiquinone biosynthesis protein UbiJ
MVLDLTSVALRPFESLLNHGIGRSATAATLAARLEGRSLAIAVTGLPRAFHLALAGGRATLAASDAPADVTIAGTPLSLLRLLATDPQALFRDGELALTGSPDLAAEFRELLQFAAPDLEDLLARVVGDPLAHQAGAFAAEVRATAGRATESLARSLGEYLTEERRSLPSRFEADEFAAAVDELVAAVDRAEARLAQLGAVRRGGGDRGPA